MSKSDFFKSEKPKPIKIKIPDLGNVQLHPIDAETYISYGEMLNNKLNQIEIDAFLLEQSAFQKGKRVFKDGERTKIEKAMLPIPLRTIAHKILALSGALEDFSGN